MAALDGIRVLDFSQVIFGPVCTQVLADHGADVIKIERPGQGDLARAFGPWLKDESLPYLSLNRSKRSIALNLKDQQGLEVVHRLLDKTDVLVHNFRPGAMERLGLGYPDLEERYPQLIYALGSGYGTKGPYPERNKGGHESMAQALSGLAHRFRAPGGTPMRLPYTVADFTAGMLMTQAILLALLARQRTGRGQSLEVALLDGALAMQNWETTGLLNAPRWDPEGTQAQRTDYGASGATHPYGNPLDGAVFATADGHLMVTALFRPFEVLMANLSQALDIDDLAADQRFADLESATAHREELRTLLEPIFTRRSNAEWIERLEALDILCAPVVDTAQALEDPQFEVNQMIVEIDYPQLGKIKHVGTPLRLQGTPPAQAKPAPALGQHTDQVLGEAGYTADQIATLRQNQIVA